MPRTIFDLVKNNHIAAYWTTIGQEPSMTEELFPAAKKLGLDLKWIRGAKGLSVVLKMSAFDTAAVPRGRIGFKEVFTEMPYHKESSYIDEELRQQLNMVISSGNQVLIDSIMTRVFDDEMRLLRGAYARREQMRMMMLTTGIIAIVSNGQEFTFDYGVEHKATSSLPWSDPDSDPLEDLRIGKDTIQEETGEIITRAMCDGLSWKNLRNNAKIKGMFFANAYAPDAFISDDRLKSFISDQLRLTVVINDNRYIDDDGDYTRYMPENTFVMFPSGALGNTWFGTTPQESDLMTASAANVSIVDTGVSITTVTKPDPVQVETIVSQICLPSFERADSVYILDTAG